MFELQGVAAHGVDHFAQHVHQVDELRLAVGAVHARAVQEAAAPRGDVAGEARHPIDVLVVLQFAAPVLELPAERVGLERRRVGGVFGEQTQQAVAQRQQRLGAVAVGVGRQGQRGDR